MTPRSLLFSSIMAPN